MLRGDRVHYVGSPCLTARPRLLTECLAKIRARGPLWVLISVWASPDRGYRKSPPSSGTPAFRATVDGQRVPVAPRGAWVSPPPHRRAILEWSPAYALSWRSPLPDTSFSSSPCAGWSKRVGATLTPISKRGSAPVTLRVPTSCRYFRGHAVGVLRERDGGRRNSGKESQWFVAAWKKARKTCAGRDLPCPQAICP